MPEDEAKPPIALFEVASVLDDMLMVFWAYS
jgi:hypothetical protein